MRSLLFVGPLLLAGLVVALAALPVKDPQRRAAVARGIGFWTAAVTMALFFVFLAGEAFDDPGGAAAVGLVLLWGVPLVALVLLAVRRPQVATPVLVAALLVPVGWMAWGIVDFAAWTDFQEEVGPVGAVLVMVVGTALVFLGRHPTRTLQAGAFLVALALVQPVMSLALEGGRLPQSTLAVTVPVLLTGLLYLWAARLGRTVQAPPVGPGPGTLGSGRGHEPATR